MSSKPKQQGPDKPVVKAVGHSVDEFRASYDKAFIVPKKIKETLVALGGNWLRESDFAKMAGVSLLDLGAYRDQFADHVVLLTGEHRGKRAWAGTKAAAQKMREMVSS